MSNSDWYSKMIDYKHLSPHRKIQDAINKAESQRYAVMLDDDGHEGFIKGLEYALKLLDDSPAVQTKSLSLDVSLEKVRALHRVWRALNDGDCPKCHKFHAATDIIRRTGVGAPNIQCPSCKFYIFMSEIEDIERLFAPAMDAAVAIFEYWRSKGRVLS